MDNSDIADVIIKDAPIALKAVSFGLYTIVGSSQEVENLNVVGTWTDDEGIDNVGDVGTFIGWTLARIPVTESTEYSLVHNDNLWLPTEVGQMGFFDGVTKLSTIDMSTLDASDDGLGKKFTTPVGCDFVYVNVKVSAAQTSDYTGDVFVESGSTVGTRSKIYYSVAEMIADGYTTADPEVKAATFLENAKEGAPDKWAVGQSAPADTSISVTLSAVAEATQDFYVFSVMDHTLANQKLAADWAKSYNHCLYVTSESDPAVLSADYTGSLQEYCDTLSNTRVSIIYNANASTIIPEGGVVGAFITLDIGSYTLMFKEIPGLVPSSLTKSERENAKSNGVNVYVARAANNQFNMIQWGTATGGGYVDELMGKAWIESQIETGLLNAYRDNAKIPFDGTGEAIVVSIVASVLDEAIVKGICTDTLYNDEKEQVGGYAIHVVPMAEIAGSVKQSRIYENQVTFDYWTSTAMHSITITGYPNY